MEASLRNTPALVNKIEKIRDDLIKRFQNIVVLADIEKGDRNTTALAQYQLHTETAVLIRLVEELQSLIRQMQEGWLFGQLNTTGDSQVQRQTDEDAKTVAGLLKLLTERQNGTETNGEAMSTDV